MLEAMLFGHEKGAFTGASSANKGILEQQIMEHCYWMKFQKCHYHFRQNLRVLQEKKVTPIGGQRDIDVNR